MMSQRIMRWVFIPFFIFLVGCDEVVIKDNTDENKVEDIKETPADENPTTPPVENPPVAQPDPGPQPQPNPGPPPPSEPQPPTPTPVSPIDRICSKLDFKDVNWPVTMTEDEQMQFALALNITGSFEGNVGWKNLAGNFDGQGISMGLMQQNLGQGTLQPLWIEMFQKDRGSLTRNLSSAQVLTLQRMLEAWRGGTLPPSISSAQTHHTSLQAIQTLSKSRFQGVLFPNVEAFNELDVDYRDTDMGEANTKNQNSVAWAKAEALDARGQVLSSWRGPLERIAETPVYRSLQIQASMTYFLKAQAYFQSFGYTELRSLLLMYDFVVQNGSIGQNHLKIYNDWLKRNPNASEEQKTLALLEARLTTVKDQYKNDVRARKTTIIKGQGVVHQKNRNLPREYCFNHLSPLKLGPQSVVSAH